MLTDKIILFFETWKEHIQSGVKAIFFIRRSYFMSCSFAVSKVLLRSFFPLRFWVLVLLDRIFWAPVLLPLIFWALALLYQIFSVQVHILHDILNRVTSLQDSLNRATSWPGTLSPGTSFTWYFESWCFLTWYFEACNTAFLYWLPFDIQRIVCLCSKTTHLLALHFSSPVLPWLFFDSLETLDVCW